MSVTAAALRKLAALNLSAEQLAGVIDVLADQQEAEEARLASQRDRKRRQRAKSQDGHGTVTGQERDTPSPLIPPDKEPPTPQEINPPISPQPSERERAPTPSVVLQSVLDPMSAQSFASHCSEKRRPLSSQQAEEIVSVLRAVRAGGGKPAEAVRLAISQGWTTIKLDWLQNAGMQIQKSAATPPDEWTKRLEVWRGSGTWAEAWGPKPGEHGCRAPPELLRAA